MPPTSCWYESWRLFYFAEDFGPHHQRREAARLIRDLGPDIVYEFLVVHFEAHVQTLHRVASRLGHLFSVGGVKHLLSGELGHLFGVGTSLSDTFFDKMYYNKS